MIPKWKIGIILGMLVMVSLFFLFLLLCVLEELFLTVGIIVGMLFLFPFITLLKTKSVRWKIVFILGILVMLSLSFLFFLLNALFLTVVIITGMLFLFPFITLLKIKDVRWKIVIVAFLIFLGGVAWLYLSHPLMLI